MLLQLLLLKLQLLKLLLLYKLLTGSWVPPSIGGEILLGLDNSRGRVCTVFHRYRLLRKMSVVKMSKYATLLCFLPVTLCNRLHDRVKELPYTDWQNPPY